MEDHQVEGVQHGEEDPPGPEDVGEPVHQACQELVCQPLYLPAAVSGSCLAVYKLPGIFGSQLLLVGVELQTLHQIDDLERRISVLFVFGHKDTAQ